MLWRAALSEAGFLASPVTPQWTHTGAVLEKLQTIEGPTLDVKDFIPWRGLHT